MESLDDGPFRAAGGQERAAVATSEGALVHRGGAAPPRLRCDVPDVVRLAQRGDAGAVARLLDGGEDPDRADDFGLTALHCAAKKGHGSVVALLLERRADPGSGSRGWRDEAPLHFACKYGHAEVARLLLESRADPAAATSEGRTPQQYAQESGHGAVLAQLWGQAAVAPPSPRGGGQPAAAGL